MLPHCDGKRLVSELFNRRRNRHALGEILFFICFLYRVMESIQNINPDICLVHSVFKDLCDDCYGD